jgi:heme A synthase
MALVVTARSSVEPHSGLIQPALARQQRRGAVQWLAAASAACYGLALVVEGAARFAPSAAWLTSTMLASAALAIVLTLSACIATWLMRRQDAELLLATTLAVVLVAIRAITVALLLRMDLAAVADVTNAGLGLLVLSCLLWAATVTLVGPIASGRAQAATIELFRRITEVTTLVILGVALTGVTVRAIGAGWACEGAFPDCNGLGLLPFGRDPLADIQLYHRLLAYAALGLVLWLTIEAFRSHRAASGLRRASLALLASTLFDGAVGGASVSLSNPPLEP